MLQSSDTVFWTVAFSPALLTWRAAEVHTENAENLKGLNYPVATASRDTLV